MRYQLLFILLFFYAASNSQILPGAYRTELYIEKLKNKKVAIVGNQTSLIGEIHLVDTLLKRGITITKIFGPEHGFRGHAEAGEKIKNETDAITGIKIVSLYGKNKRPKPTDMQDIDIIVFDIQDVGVRFFTYVSTLQYIMEACAENNVALLILDRPNPNGNCIDGPVMEAKYKSFVGMNLTPIIYGMTIGEYAQMVNEEGWLKNNLKCKLNVIPCKGYTHDAVYELPVKPSPNLPNFLSIKLYASLAIFEGTQINVGRGTDFPFQVFGHPLLDSSNITYTPTARPGATTPPHKDTLCHGIDLRGVQISNIECFNLQYIIFAYKHFPEKDKFFNRYFYNLTGTAVLRTQIEMGISEDEIKKGWQADLENFKKIRVKYLMYP